MYMNLCIIMIIRRSRDPAASDRGRLAGVQFIAAQGWRKFKFLTLQY